MWNKVWYFQARLRQRRQPPTNQSDPAKKKVEGSRKKFAPGRRVISTAAAGGGRGGGQQQQHLADRAFWHGIPGTRGKAPAGGGGQSRLLAKEWRRAHALLLRNALSPAQHAHPEITTKSGKRHHKQGGQNMAALGAFLAPSPPPPAGAN